MSAEFDVSGEVSTISAQQNNVHASIACASLSCIVARSRMELGVSGNGHLVRMDIGMQKQEPGDAACA
jgi:hypothetical protein